MTVDIVMNHATFRGNWDMENFVAACTRRGLDRISIWGEEVDKIGVSAAAKLVKQNQMQILGYNRTGPFIAADKSTRASLIEAAKVEINKAAALGADHVLVFPGGLPAGSKDITGVRQQTIDIIGGLLETANAQGTRLAVEPLHPMLAGDRSCINTLKIANDICDQLGKGIGIVIDVYHVWWDDSVEREILRAGNDNRILGFHVNDWLIPTKHLLTDRGMMGDGVIALDKLWHIVQNSGYRGPIEVEIFSDYWWQQDPSEVMDTALERCSKIFTKTVK